jgi:predicted AAA+ superfamily ATPase
MITRYIDTHIQNALWKGKTILVYGPRQAWKTTLLKKYIQSPSMRFLTSDYLSDIERLSTRNRATYEQAMQWVTLLIIDEAQNIPDIGISLKLLHDQFPACQIIATWSSSFELAQRTQEAMTWRTITFSLMPLWIHELFSPHDQHLIEQQYPSILNYWLYPSIYTHTPASEKPSILHDLVQGSLFKDVLQFEWIKKSQTIIKLAQMLAYQIGKPVSYSELANKLQISAPTVEKYCTILEQAFILFRVWSYSKNLRKELSKWVKRYFWDIGIRNSLISMHQDINIRGDKWEIRENFVIAEFFKKKLHTRQLWNFYFRRTYDGQELDLLYENNWQIEAFEIKRKDHKSFSPPQAFVKTYPTTEVTLITQDTFLSTLLKHSL